MKAILFNIIFIFISLSFQPFLARILFRKKGKILYVLKHVVIFLDTLRMFSKHRPEKQGLVYLPLISQDV